MEKGKYPKQARNKRIAIMLNEREQRALENFCTRYNITNRSRLVRETLMRAILKKIDNDQPTLFDQSTRHVKRYPRYKKRLPLGRRCRSHANRVTLNRSLGCGCVGLG